MKRGAVISICVFLLIQGLAFAHEREKHGKEHKADVQMQKLHEIMPMYAIALPKVEVALENSDSAAVETEVEKILVTAPDLKKMKPHKNFKQLKKFGKIATGFEKDLKATVDLAKIGDFARARIAFQRAEARCAECHARFRD